MNDREKWRVRVRDIRASGTIWWWWFHINGCWCFFQWPQVSRTLLSSSFEGLHSSFYFKVLQSLYQSFSDCTKSTNNNWYNRHFVPQIYQFPSKVEVLILLFTFLKVYSVVSRNIKVHNSASSSLIIIRSGRLAEIRWSICMSIS